MPGLFLAGYPIDRPDPMIKAFKWAYIIVCIGFIGFQAILG